MVSAEPALPCHVVAHKLAHFFQNRYLYIAYGTLYIICGTNQICRGCLWQSAPNVINMINRIVGGDDHIAPNILIIPRIIIMNYELCIMN